MHLRTDGQLNQRIMGLIITSAEDLSTAFQAPLNTKTGDTEGLYYMLIGSHIMRANFYNVMVILFSDQVKTDYSQIIKTEATG